MRMLPVNEWSCSVHEFPDRCECCETWRCVECEGSSWVRVAEREASPFEEMLLAMPVRFPSPLVARALLDG